MRGVLPMMAFIACGPLALAQELPKAEPTDALEIEPPLLIKDGKPIPRSSEADAPEKTVEDLTAMLERTRKSAAAGERQFRAGIISKAQAEERLVKAVQVEAALAEARARLARQEYEGAKEQRSRGEISQAQLEDLARASEQAIAAQRSAEAERQRTEIEAARSNVARQQKLLALGSGRKADVERAEAKLSELMRPND
jgi:hypothetical protein